MLLIVNSRRLRTNQARFEELKRRLSERTPIDLRLTEYSGHAEEIARQVAGDHEVIAAVGGDGTISEVATGIIASGASSRLLPIPFGTGNDYARQLGIRSMEEAVAALSGPRVRSLDVIQVVGHDSQRERSRYSVLTAGVAFGAEVMRYTSDRIKRLFGSRASYSVGLFLALARYRPPRLRIQASDRSFDDHMFFVSVGNAAWSGGGTMCLSPGAVMDDGRFDVCVFDVTSKLRVLANFLRILKGTHIHLPEVTYFPATELTVESDPPSELLIDGEAFGQTPARFVIKPQALRVIGGSVKR